MERPRSLEQQLASAVDCLLGIKSALSQLNDGTATVRVSQHYTQYVAACQKVGHVSNNDDNSTGRV